MQFLWKTEKLTYICTRNNERHCNPKGRLAQLVQSTSFTPRGSGVRTPHRPLLSYKPPKSSDFGGFFYGSKTKLFFGYSLQL